MKNNNLRNERGFTLIEIIAVLVILGVLAVVAIPKYLDVAMQGRILAAQGAIAEVKSRLSAAQGKYMLAYSGSAPTSANLYSYAITANAYSSATNLANVGTDFNVTTAGASAPITITVDKVGGKTLSTSVVGNFNAAGD